MKASLALAMGGHSHAGSKDRNDDAFAAKLPTSKYVQQMKGGVACIADGISVSDRSHLASQLAVTQFIDDYYATPDGWSVEESASRVLRALNDWLYSQSRHNQTSAMVTTFSTVIVKSNSLHIFHVGDSRIYRIRGKSIEQLTRDHSVNITRNDSVLTASLGMDARLSVDYSRIDAEVGDVVVLVTDGILEGLSATQLMSGIQQYCETGASLDDVAKHVCKHALDGGSKDNLTCGLMRIEGLPVENIDEAYQRVAARKIPPVMTAGNIIDDFKVLDTIHAGARSHVYKVKNIKTDKNYILKTPSLNFQDDIAYLDGFIREQWVGGRLDHPNLMRAYKGADNSQFQYLVSEYIAGQTLQSWMLDHPEPTLAQVRDIISQTTSGLRQLHRRGMIHRDLKPANIMITAQGDVKIIDFGSVLVAGMKDLNSPIDDEHAAGALNYSAPELVLGQAATSQSDIFSLGVLTYEMLMGERPFADKQSNRRKATHYGDWSYRHGGHNGRSDIPHWIESAVEKACSPNPNKRYPVMSEFIEDLKRPGHHISERKNAVALLERNPLAFWKGLAFIALGLCLFLLILLARTHS